MNELAQFFTCVIKVFALNRVVRAVRDARPYQELAQDLNLALEEAVRWEVWFDSG